MSQLADSLREFIEANHYQYSDVGDDCYRLRFNGVNASYDMFASASDERGQIMVVTQCPVHVPESNRTLVADYINRVNYGLYLGCLEMDADTGYVRARSSGPVGNEEVPSDVLRSLFDSSFYPMDNWLPGLLRIAFGTDDPKTAFEATLNALSGEAIVPSEEDPQLDEAPAEPGPALTAIEEEVARLLADRDSDPESSAQPS